MSTVRKDKSGVWTNLVRYLSQYGTVAFNFDYYLCKILNNNVNNFLLYLNSQKPRSATGG
jgi:hypothetical protein